MNYCCARGNCPGCIARWQDRRRRIAELEEREARRVLLGNAKHPPEKQNKIVDDVVKEYSS